MHRLPPALSCAAAVGLVGLSLSSSGILDAQARVTKIIIDQHYTPCPAPTTPPTPLPPNCSTGLTSGYESYAGRAFGVLDPDDPHNQIITDINKGKSADGKVHYVASWYIVKPTDMSKASGLMWHDVPNRGGRITIVAAEQALGDVGLSSGWQADDAGATLYPVGPDGVAIATATPTSPGNDWVQVPVARNKNGSLVTGKVLARIVNRSGPNSAPLNVMGNPLPYWPATLDTSKATLVTHTHETTDGIVTVGSTIASSDWAWATCSATNPFPGTPIQAPPGPAGVPNTATTPNPLQICLKNGFDPKLLYQVVYPATNAYLLGVGHAAFRDVDSFFRYQTKDDSGTPSPLAGAIKWSVIRGVSQSGNMTRAFIHLGFNEDEEGRKVHDGAWPIIAGRRVAADMRWGQPDGVLELYQMGYEGPQWWADWPDFVRHLPTRGILDRCSGRIPLGNGNSDDEEDDGGGHGHGKGDDDGNEHHKGHNTCPKIIEHFGSSEVWALKMTTSWVGTFPVTDIPLPSNVRRYYISSTTHGGGAGGFSTPLYNSTGALQANQYPTSSLPGVSCPGNNWGTGLYPANPVPEAEVQNALRISFRNWVMHDEEPLPSMWPRIDQGTLADANNLQALGFPSGIPGVPAGVPGNAFIMPGFDYNWGPHFNETDATGVPTNLPPPILKVIEMLAPKVDADGNELGGVPQVLRAAPLGTYVGWNVTANTATNPFHAGQICNYIGGFIPFAATKAQRLTLSPPDPRLSLEERYCSHAGYVSAVTAAVNKAVAAGYLLQADGTSDIAAASASGVCGGAGGFCNPANTTCTPPSF